MSNIIDKEVEKAAKILRMGVLLFTLQIQYGELDAMLPTMLQ